MNSNEMKKMAGEQPGSLIKTAFNPMGALKSFGGMLSGSGVAQATERAGIGLGKLLPKIQAGNKQAIGRYDLYKKNIHSATRNQNIARAGTAAVGGLGVGYAAGKSNPNQY